jgi:acyl carrier protein
MMDRAALQSALKQMLEEERGESFESLDENAALREELGLDSVDLVSLVMKIQDKLRVVLASDDLESIRRVGDLLDLLQRKLAGVKQAA